MAKELTYSKVSDKEHTVMRGDFKIGKLVHREKDDVWKFIPLAMFAAMTREDTASVTLKLDELITGDFNITPIKPKDNGPK